MNVNNIYARLMVDKFIFTDTDEYNPENNYRFAELSNLVYADSDKIMDQVWAWERTDPSIDCIIRDVGPYRFMVLYNERFIILVFRGSANLSNWITDLDKKLTGFKQGSGYVHAGFYKSVQEMERAINSILKLVRTNNQKIYITGHSLGGAQALLSAFVCDSLKDFERITTFGQPRVGDKNFAKWVTEKIQNDAKNKSKYFRVVNKYDPVANLPYWGYYHCNNFYLSCNEGENYTCKDGEFKRPFGGTTESMVEDIKAVNSESMVEDIKAVNSESMVEDIKAVNSESMVEDIKAVNSESMVEDIVAIKFNLFANHYMELYLKNAFRNINYDPFHR